MKRLLCLVPVFLLFITGWGCKGKKDYYPGDFIKKAFSEDIILEGDEFQLQMRIIQYGSEEIFMNIAFCGDKINIFTSNPESGETIDLIFIEDTLYSVTHSDKTITVKHNALFSDYFDLSRFDYSMYLTGGYEIERSEIEYMGKPYCCEKVYDGKTVLCFLFDKNSLFLRYIITNYSQGEEVVEFLGYTRKVSPKLFELPEGYSYN